MILTITTQELIQLVLRKVQEDTGILVNSSHIQFHCTGDDFGSSTVRVEIDLEGAV